MNSLIVYGFIFTILPLLSFEQAIYLFNTEDTNDDVQYYDCIILDTISYCRRPNFLTDMFREKNTSICYNNGKIWTFDSPLRK